MQLRFEELERAPFGYRMARLTLDSTCTAADAERIVEMYRSSGVEMLTLRIPTDKVALVQAQEALEFRTMDCLVYYECSTEELPLTKPSTAEIREATAEDATAVAEVARLCFTDYFSHYHADARLDRAKVSEAYVDWAQRSCADREVASCVYVAILEGTVAGFITLRHNSPTEGEGVLNAVHPSYAGAGIYGQLITRVMQWCRDNGMKRIVISTQIDNRGPACLDQSRLSLLQVLLHAPSLVYLTARVLEADPTLLTLVS
jgi:GNAT superfamily N-acetyltransferase